MNEYEVRVTRQALEQMKIKQEQKPLEYFERMLPSYDEYVRERYPESIELGNELSKQESKSTILQQNDGMYNIANDEVNKVQNPVSDNLTEVLMRRDFWSDFWMRHKDYRHQIFTEVHFYEMVFMK
jgi:hypothetical protein